MLLFSYKFDVFCSNFKGDFEQKGVQKTMTLHFDRHLYEKDEYRAFSGPHVVENVRKVVSMGDLSAFI